MSLSSHICAWFWSSLTICCITYWALWLTCLNADSLWVEFQIPPELWTMKTEALSQQDCGRTWSISPRAKLKLTSNNQILLTSRLHMLRNCSWRDIRAPGLLIRHISLLLLLPPSTFLWETGLSEKESFPGDSWFPRDQVWIKRILGFFWVFSLWILLASRVLSYRHHTPTLF